MDQEYNLDDDSNYDRLRRELVKNKVKGNSLFLLRSKLQY